jgi:spermidine/putrescine transport system ATP-binding protein/putrescine transport system ATP-binding protein
MTLETPLLSITGVSKAYGDVVALDNVSLDIRQNEFFALLGPSGCGKTTLLRSIAGFEDPDVGSISILGPNSTTPINLLALPPNKRPVNLMFQSYALFPHMNVRKNIMYGLQREGLSKEEIAERVEEVLVTTGLIDKASVRPAQLSGGQRQRVALARAIVKRPRLLLLDEPLSALDRKVRAEMQIELKRLQHEVGITFVVVTHDQEEAMSMADRIAVMHEGRVQQIADPVTLYAQPANVFVADFIGSGSLLHGTASQSSFSAYGSTFPCHNPDHISGDAVLVLRPEDVRVTGVTSTDNPLLVGTIIETHFYGGSSSTSVRVPGVEHVIVASHPGAPQHHVGEQVGLSWDPQTAVLLQDHQ